MNITLISESNNWSKTIQSEVGKKLFDVLKDLKLPVKYKSNENCIGCYCAVTFNNATQF